MQHMRSAPWSEMEPGSPALEAWSLNHWATREIPALESWGVGSTGPGIQAWGPSFPLFGCLEHPSPQHLLVFLGSDKSFRIPLCAPCHCFSSWICAGVLQLPHWKRRLALASFGFQLLSQSSSSALSWQLPCTCVAGKRQRAVFSISCFLFIPSLLSLVSCEPMFLSGYPEPSSHSPLKSWRIQACRPLSLSLFALSTLTCPVSHSADLWQMKRKLPLLKKPQA